MVIKITFKLGMNNNDESQHLLSYHYVQHHVRAFHELFNPYNHPVR